jgi:PIN domain nuclease of toxin-antitoxin system
LKLLLDTHIWIWSVLDPGKLSRRVASAMDENSTELWLSPLSIWELKTLTDQGRIKLDFELEHWVEKTLRAAPLREAPLTHAVVLAMRKIQLPHRDPVDAFLAATALVFELTLVTSDEKLLAAKQIPTMANR